MKFQVSSIVTGVRSEKDTRIIWDGGIFRVRAGEWLLYSGDYGPATFEDFTDENILPLDLPPNQEEEELELALERGYL